MLKHSLFVLNFTQFSLKRPNHMQLHFRAASQANFSVSAKRLVFELPVIAPNGQRVAQEKFHVSIHAVVHGVHHQMGQ